MIAMVLVGTVGFICIFVAHRREQFNNLYGLVPLDRVSFHISLTVTTIAVRVWQAGDDAHFALGFLVMILLIANVSNAGAIRC